MEDAGAGFASALVLDGDRLAVGSPDATPPVIHLYVRHHQAWAEEALLEGTEVSFGRYLALRGDLLAVGLPWAGRAGQVAVYRHHHDGWRLEAILEGPAGSPGGFGSALALEGGLLYVGAPGGPESGEVLVFAPGHDWRLMARITPRERVGFDGFGAALAIHGDALAVTALWLPVPTVVVLHRTSGRMERWQEVARLAEPERRAESSFGLRLALRDGVLAVACATPSGEVWVYRRHGRGWIETARLEAPAEITGMGMAHDLAIGPGADHIIAAAPWATVDGLGRAGLVLIFDRGPRGWTLERTLHAPEPLAEATFGHALAADSGLLVVGVPDREGGGQVLTFSLRGP
jgi:hypothetical protein